MFDRTNVCKAQKEVFQREKNMIILLICLFRKNNTSFTVSFNDTEFQSLV